MPHQSVGWDPITGVGNPTKLALVNKMIQKLKKHKVCGEGVPSAAHRALEWDEFHNIVVGAKELYYPNENARITVLAVLTLQWQLIGFIDNIK